MSKFIDEINEQPGYLQKLIDEYEFNQPSKIEKAAEMLKEGPDKVIFTGMGTSHFCPLVVQRQFTSSDFNYVLYEAGELLHYYLDAIRDCTLIAVSQSGESVETKKVVKNSVSKVPIISITNCSQSIIAKESDLDLQLFAGEESSISNKTYTNSLALLLMLAAEVVAEDLTGVFRDLKTCVDLLNTYQNKLKNCIHECANFLGTPPFIHFISRGPSMVAALQGALIFNEGARVYTQALSGGAFRHGPLEVTGPDHRAVFFAPQGKTYQLLVKVANEAAEMGSKVAFFTNGVLPNEFADHKNVFPIILEGELSEVYFPILSSLPLELLLHKMAENRGIEAGVFKKVSKVTTEE